MTPNLTLQMGRISFQFDPDTETCLKLMEIEPIHWFYFRDRLQEAFPDLLEAEINDYGSVIFMMDWEDLPHPVAPFMLGLQAFTWILIEEFT